jgi:hypothetical protein
MLKSSKSKYLIRIFVVLALTAFVFFQDNKSYAAQQFIQASDFPSYVARIYWFGSAIVGAVAVVAIVIAGINYMRSMGNPEVITRSKEIIGGALIGLFLILGSYLLLKTMDPRLVELKLAVPEKGLPAAQKIGSSCDPQKDTGETTDGFEYHKCEVGDDAKGTTPITLVCDQTVKRWKAKEGEICLISQVDDHASNCIACDDRDYYDDTYPAGCVTGTSCEKAEKAEERLGVDLCTGWRNEGRVYRCKK